MFRIRPKDLACVALGLGMATASVAAGGGRTEDAVRLFDARNFREARPLLEAALQEDPSDARAALYLGRLFLSEGNADRAVEWIEKSAALESNRAETHLWLGRAYGAKAMAASVLAQPSLAGKVRREFERASALDPEGLEARFGLIEFYLRAPGILGGSVEKARAQAAEVGRRDPMQGHRAAGRVAEYEKRFDAAREEYAAAARDFPDRKEPQYWLGLFYERRKDYAGAF